MRTVKSARGSRSGGGWRRGLWSPGPRADTAIGRSELGEHLYILRIACASSETTHVKVHSQGAVAFRHGQGSLCTACFGVRGAKKGPTLKQQLHWYEVRDSSAGDRGGKRGPTAVE